MGNRRVLVAVAVVLTSLGSGMVVPVAAEDRNPREERARPGDDTSGRVQRGEASDYHPRLEGRPMANGERPPGS